MPTVYPGALDSFVNPTDTDTLDSPPHDGQHTDVNDAAEAIEAELGLNPRGAFATVRARLDDIEVEALVRVRRAANQSISDSTDTEVSFDAEDHDTDTMWSAGNPTRITFTTAGKYALGAISKWSGGTNSRKIRFRLNGTTVLTETEVELPAGSLGVATFTERIFAAADYIEVQVTQFSGGALDVTAVVHAHRLAS